MQIAECKYGEVVRDRGNLIPLHVTGFTYVSELGKRVEAVENIGIVCTDPNGRKVVCKPDQLELY